jgi:hypothetical protein
VLSEELVELGQDLVGFPKVPGLERTFALETSLALDESPLIRGSRIGGQVQPRRRHSPFVAAAQPKAGGGGRELSASIRGIGDVMEAESGKVGHLVPRCTEDASQDLWV